MAANPVPRRVPQVRLLAGPPSSAGPEPLESHAARLGPLPGASPGANGRRTGAGDLIPMLEASGLLGRGGAAFPVGRKWRTVADRADGHAVVVANGAEGEPRSWKDRALMAFRPHLVLDGAMLAAAAIGAEEIVVYVGGEHAEAVSAMRRAIAERGAASGESRGNPPVRLVTAPRSYVAGEASAVINYLESGDARPTTKPPSTYERGVRGLPTLVQNVESLAYAALIARYGYDWYRSAGRASVPGTALVTLSGAVQRPGVREIELGTPLRDVLGGADGSRSDARAVLLGGYFGGWVDLDRAPETVLDPAALSDAGLGFGCGVVSVLPTDACGVDVTARILGYMAAQSARQCGPCVFGLAAIAKATTRLASGTAEADDLARIDRWSLQLPGRGACHHPDGAAGLLRSALQVFGDDFERHQLAGSCSGRARARDAGVGPVATNVERGVA